MSRALLLLAAIALAVIAWAIGTAHAQDRGAWFKSLKQPDTGVSCCDVSDCRRTNARWEGEGWQAVVNGEWRTIPANKVLQKPHSIDGDAYVCNGPEWHDDDGGGSSPGLIFCFIPPDMGS